MVITCQNCGARFNLNEELLKPAGSKVKCTKCDHVFRVFPPAPPEEEPVEPELDLPPTEALTAPPEPDDTSESVEVEDDQAEPDSESLEELDFGELDRMFAEDGLLTDSPTDEAAPKDDALDFDDPLELDSATDKPLDDDLDDDLEAPLDGLLFEDPQLDAEADTGDIGDTASELGDLDQLEKILNEDFDHPLEASESDSETPQILTKEDLEGDIAGKEIALDVEDIGAQRVEATDEATAEIEDEEESDTIDLADLDKLLLRDLDKDTEALAQVDETEVPETESSLPEEKSEPAEQALDDKMQVETSAETFDAPKEAPAPTTPAPPPPVAKARKRGGVGKFFLFLLILLLIAAGLYGAYVYSRIKGIDIPYLDKLNLPIPNLTTGGAPTDENGVARLKTVDITSRFITSTSGQKLFIITGKVFNDYPQSRGLIEVRGNLFSSGGQKTKTVTVFCGNVLSDLDIKALPATEVQSRLSRRGAEDDSQMSVAAGSTLPFMIAFSDLPPDLEEFTIEIVSSVAL